MDRYEHRKSSKTLLITDRAGQPLKNLEVRAELKKHEFLFGTGAFFAEPLANGTAADGKMEYLRKIYDEWKDVFNYGTLPFYLGRYEPKKGQPNEKSMKNAAQLLWKDGKAVKGHPLCWHTVCAPWMYGMTNAEVLDYFLFRIEREISSFRSEISFWDVLNEVVIMPEFTNEPAFLPQMNPVTRLCREMGRVTLVKALFDRAHRVNPSAKLLLNDFNTGPRYAELIGDCLDAGVGIDVIGIQSHQHQGFWGMEKLAEVTERFEKFGLPIHFTENTFVSGELMPPEIVDLNDFRVTEWPSTPEGEARQADDLMRMMDYLFARPLVEGFTTWDFEDHQWLRAPSGLIHSDGRPKPALEALKKKLKTDWHTCVTLRTDENGFTALAGFRGEYEISSHGSVARVTLGKDGGVQTVALGSDRA